MQPCQRFLIAVLFAFLTAMSANAAEENYRGECLVQTPFAYQENFEKIDDASTAISADTVRGNQSEELVFEGNVVLRQAEREVRADQVQVLENPRQIKIKGNIAANDQDLFVTAEHGSMDDVSLVCAVV